MVGGSYCRLQMPWKLVLADRETRLGVDWATWRGEGGYVPPFQCIAGLHESAPKAPEKIFDWPRPKEKSGPNI